MTPLLAKDNLATKGPRTTYGALPFAHNVPAEDAICVVSRSWAGPSLRGLGGASR